MARIRAPRARASSARSRTSTAAPSADDEAVPVRVEGTGRGRMFVSPPGQRAHLAEPGDQRGASEAPRAPPVITTSQAPLRSRSRAVPIAVVPEAQAVAVTSEGPRAPNSIETYPAAMLTDSMGMSRGETRRGPAVEEPSVLGLPGLGAADAVAEDDADPGCRPRSPGPGPSRRPPPWRRPAPVGWSGRTARPGAAEHGGRVEAGHGAGEVGRDIREFRHSAACVPTPCRMRSQDAAVPIPAGVIMPSR